MNIKILITGAGGQVGRELVDLCVRKCLKFTAYNSSQLDITENDKVMSLLSRDQPTHVINTAAYTAVNKAEDEPEKAYAVNAKGPKNIALACKKIGAKLIHLSTDYVFDGQKNGDYTVDDEPNPQSVYGLSKLKGERLISETLDEYFILRVSWVFGKYGNNFVKKMLTLASERDEISVVNDQYGAPTPADRIAECILSTEVLNQLKGLDHLESNPKVSWFQFAKFIFNANDINIKVNGISSDEYPTKAVYPNNSKLSSVNFSINWKSRIQVLADNIL